MPIKILLVDDDEAYRAVTAIALESAGYAVREAADGHAALEAMRRETPDVVISDLSMPEMDGRELCRRVRRTPSFAGVRLLVLSALIESDAACVAPDFEADCCLSKQSQPDRLFEQIEALVTR